MPRDSRSPEELKKASNHLAYELNMLFFLRPELSEAMRGGVRSITDTYLTNAILESFLVHVRNIIDFFYNLSPRGDDVIAGDFISNWRELSPPITALLSETKERSNKHLVHLTYARIDLEESEEWQFEKIEKDIKKVLKEFFENVSEEHLNSKIEQIKNILIVTDYS